MGADCLGVFVIDLILMFTTYPKNVKNEGRVFYCAIAMLL